MYQTKEECRLRLKELNRQYELLTQQRQALERNMQGIDIEKKMLDEMLKLHKFYDDIPVVKANGTNNTD